MAVTDLDGLGIALTLLSLEVYGLGFRPCHNLRFIRFMVTITFYITGLYSDLSILHLLSLMKVVYRPLVIS